MLHQGLPAPASGSIPRNCWWSAIDSQITTEGLGALAPGMRQRAADLAGRFGSVTNDGFALHAAQYYAAMYSQAVVESNLERLLAASVARYDPADDQANLLGIIDGITDVSYNGHRAYSTFDWINPQPAGGDYYQLNFDRLVNLTAVVFYEGDFQSGGVNAFPDANSQPARGGWFQDLNVEVGRDGNFVPATGLVLSEPLDPYQFYQVITLRFSPIEGNAVRIGGTAGGVDEFTTCLELEAYGFVSGTAGNQWTSPGGN